VNDVMGEASLPSCGSRARRENEPRGLVLESIVPPDEDGESEASEPDDQPRDRPQLARSATSCRHFLRSHDQRVEG
jgi:hypothetical protein